MVVLMHTCDAYSWQWDSFIRYFDKFWVGDHQKFIATEEKTAKYDGWDNIKTGKGEWSDRLIKALNMIGDDYVFYIQEDIWLNKPFDALKDVQSCLLADCIHYCKDSKHYDYLTPVSNYKLFSNESEYLMNHKPAVWNKNFFLKYLKPNETAWQNEINATKRIRKNKDNTHIGIRIIDYYDDVCVKGQLTEIGKRRMI